jgi:adenosylhomocysteinase
MPGSAPSAVRVPWSARSTIQGRPAEVGASIAELLGALEAQGWAALDIDYGPSPLAAARMTRGEDWLTIAISQPGNNRPVLPGQYEVCAAGMVADSGGLQDEFASLPLTDLEVELLGRDMPLTARARERARHWLPKLPKSLERPLEGFGAIFTIHHQTDFLVLLMQAIELGLDPSLITVIDKEYSYRFSRRVDAHIRRRLGIPVFTYSELREGLSDHIVRVAGAREQSMARTWTPSVVIDDGGYVLPVLRTEFQPFLSLFRGVVEQTTSGIWALRPFIREVELPIFSVAESELKSTVEAQGVAMAALTSLRRLLPNERFDGRSAVLVGFGTIGQALALLLRRQNFSVWVTDSAPSKLVTAKERGFNVSPTVVSAIEQARPSYIFSCAEPGAVSADAFARIRDDCCLVSLTSRDRAFDKAALEVGYEKRPCGNLGTIFTNEGGPWMLLLADGFPINFHFAESMPNQQSDLVMASLLVGAMALAAPGTLWPAGNDVARANAVLNEGTLLRDFLEARPGFGIFGAR